MEHFQLADKDPLLNTECVMWTHSTIHRSSTVAVPAHHLKYLRVVVLDDPAIETVPLEWRSDLSTMFFTVAVHMIQRHKCWIVFRTARTRAMVSTVDFEHLSFQFLSIPLRAGKTGGSMRLVPLENRLFILCVPFLMIFTLIFFTGFRVLS